MDAEEAEVDLYSAGFSPSAVQQLRQVVKTLDRLEVENGRLAAENVLLKRQLILLRDNAGLKVANVLGQVVSWFDDKNTTTQTATVSE